MTYPIYHPVHTRDASYFVRDIKASTDWATPKFVGWLEKNMHIWDAYCAVVEEARKKGYSSFSSRTAVHILRFRLFNKLKGSAKVDNSMTPYLGRLYNHLYARDGDFITTRPLSVKAINRSFK